MTDDDNGQWAREQERERLAALRALGILDTPREERFDAITRLMARDFHVPIAMISLVDDHHVWLKSEVGLEGMDRVPREITFCHQAIRASRIMVVEDAALDERFSDSPLVTGASAMRFYAGAVIYSSQQQPIGAVCIIDHEPRRMSYQDQRQLIDFAGHVGQEMARAGTRDQKM